MRRGVHRVGGSISKELILIIVVLAALIAINALRKRSGPTRSSQAAGVECASYSTERRGTKALYLLLAKLGYRPKRLCMPHFTDMRADGLAIILTPHQPPINRSDVERLLAWLRQGNTLLFAPGRHEDQLARSLGIELHPGRPLGASIAPIAPTNLTVGIQRLVVRSGDRILTRRMKGIQKHFGDSNGGVVISLRKGRGTAIVLSDPHLMTNAGLPEGDNLALLVNILLSYITDAETVYFDEYHHGFGDRPTVLSLLKGTSLGWALLQVAAAVALLMYSRGRRFGRPVPVLKETHRSSVEYVTSLASIYRAARASGVVLSSLYERLLRSEGSSAPSETIKELMNECRRRIGDRDVSDRDLVDLSRRMESAQHPER